MIRNLVPCLFESTWSDRLTRERKENCKDSFCYAELPLRRRKRTFLRLFFLCRLSCRFSHHFSSASSSSSFFVPKSFRSCSLHLLSSTHRFANQWHTFFDVRMITRWCSKDISHIQKRADDQLSVSHLKWTSLPMITECKKRISNSIIDRQIIEISQNESFFLLDKERSTTTTTKKKEERERKNDNIGLVIARTKRVEKEISIPHGRHSSSLNANRRNNEKSTSISFLSLSLFIDLL